MSMKFHKLYSMDKVVLTVTNFLSVTTDKCYLQSLTAGHTLRSTELEPKNHCQLIVYSHTFLPFSTLTPEEVNYTKYE